MTGRPSMRTRLCTQWPPGWVNPARGGWGVPVYPPTHRTWTPWRAAGAAGAAAWVAGGQPQGCAQARAWQAPGRPMGASPGLAPAPGAAGALAGLRRAAGARGRGRAGRAGAPGGVGLAEPTRPLHPSPGTRWPPVDHPSETALGPLDHWTTGFGKTFPGSFPPHIARAGNFFLSRALVHGLEGGLGSGNRSGKHGPLASGLSVVLQWSSGPFSTRCGRSWHRERM
ncbi:MAG: hypothetical protein RLZZ188_2683 [Verrucomicrobiota bacterium]|jgi:hypothetical protein